MNNYKDICNKAIEITKKLGTKEEGIVGGDEDYVYMGTKGYSYRFDDLYIQYETGECGSGKKCVFIYIKNKCVFSYFYKTKKIDYIDGNWVELIDMLYNQINNVLVDRQNEKIEQEKKYNKYLKLKKYFDYYSNSSKDQNLLFILNKELNKNGITVEVEKRSYYDTSSSIQCVICEKYYYVCVVKYYGNSVAEFGHTYYNSSDVPNNDYGYAQKYIPGEWKDIFKDVVKSVQKYENDCNNQMIYNSTDEMIKKIKKKWY